MCYAGIPIPNKKEAKWGLANKHFCYSPLLDKDQYRLIAQDITMFNHLDDYFIDSIYQIMDFVIKQNNLSLKKEKVNLAWKQGA
ncbi:Imm9 family immunity protein [Kingella kingae]|uniref:Imm9 family immunity protein n=1 Tax=Kingella kingae TaxID=504 RepID=UPI00117DAEC8|nr:hypothetical protein [Kingella kingae]MBD3631836.1 hypothetical protein [Kingella kingae]MBD3659237.1 hypothetical protein [Kingella kingae]QIF42508.1 hypothetical protein GB851_06850 [Kingella kingae]QIP52243.1 hypothetical protein HBA48_07215 [Kingella kingae]